MALTGKQKAAILLTCLDTSIATELLSGLDPETVQEIAVELAYMEATGISSNTQSLQVAQQFCSSLKTGGGFHLNNFMQEMLKKTIGQKKAEEVQSQIKDLLRKRDPFISIRSADSKTIALVLEEEHPQAAAVVLSELPPKKSSEVLGSLGEGIRFSAIGRMASCEKIGPEAKMRIADMVSRRIEGFGRSDTPEAPAASPDKSLRKVAVILRNLGKDLRDGLLGAIEKKDSEAGKKVSGLMIIWEDIPMVADRSLQEGLRRIDTGKLALALFKAEQTIVDKVKSNISERARATLDEEASFMTNTKTEDVEEARQDIVQILREMNESGELSFTEE